MIRRLPRLAAAATLLAAAVAAPAAAQAPDFASVGAQAYEAPRPAPALALPGLDGKTRGLAELRGKVVLVVFWATW